MPILTPIQVDSALSDVEKALVKDLLSMIGMFQKLDVFDELGVPDADLKTIRFTYPAWRDDSNIQLRKRTTSIVPVTGLVLGTDYTVDLARGVATLTTPMNPGDEVRATYKFKYFTTDDFKSFLHLSLIDANIQKPATGFTFGNLPLDFNSVIVLGAYLRCLERLLLDNGIWSRHLIWAEPEKWLAYLQNLFNKTEEMYRYWLKQLKRRGFIRVYGIASGKFHTQMQVNENNFRQWTVLGQ